MNPKNKNLLIKGLNFSLILDNEGDDLDFLSAIGEDDMSLSDDLDTSTDADNNSESNADTSGNSTELGQNAEQTQTPATTADAGQVEGQQAQGQEGQAGQVSGQAEEQSQQQQVTQQTQIPAQDQQQDQMMQQAMQNLNNKLVTQYALSEEQADKLLSEPEAVLPAMMAQMHMSIMSHVLAVVNEAQPAQFANYLQSQQRTQEAETKFKALYPDLDPKSEEVNQAVEIVKQRFPQANFEEKLKQVGLLAQVLSGKVPVVAQQVAQQQTQQQQVVARPRPASPAMSSAARAPVQTAQKSEWDLFIDSAKDY